MSVINTKEINELRERIRKLNISDTGIKMESGAVTFLDVLGWKGIWVVNTRAIEILSSLVSRTKEIADEITSSYAEKTVSLRGKSEITRVLSISDTIALFTSAPATVAIEIHALICSWLLEYAFSQKIPLRGATSYGKYSLKDNIMLGYAVDEAASWHEKTDWIGVVLTPSAKYHLGEDYKKVAKVTTYDKIPFKGSIKNLDLCIDWGFADKEDLYNIIQDKGPHSPDIAPKYLNTLAFLDRHKLELNETKN